MKLWVQTLSGGVLDLDAPQPEQIKLSDLAWGLAQQMRWNGHTDPATSVAEHSVIVAELALAAVRAGEVQMLDPRPLVVACLMHDGHEAYPPGDVAAPCKNYLRRYTTALDDLQDAIQGAINKRFGVDGSGPMNALVKRFDLQARWCERRFLLANCERDWGEDLEEPTAGWRCEFFGAQPAAAAELFLHWCADWGIR